MYSSKQQNIKLHGKSKQFSSGRKSEQFSSGILFGTKTKCIRSKKKAQILPISNFNIKKMNKNQGTHIIHWIEKPAIHQELSYKKRSRRRSQRKLVMDKAIEHSWERSLFSSVKGETRSPPLNPSSHVSKPSITEFTHSFTSL